MGSGQSNLIQIRKRKLAQRQEIISKDLSLLTNILQEQKISEQYMEKITHLPIQDIVEQLNSHRITSKQLTAIFCYRTATIALKLGLITEVNFRNAIKMAQHCDQVRKSSKKRNWTFKDSQDNINDYLHPLFGVPISIKDTIDMEGLSSSIGITHRAFQIKKQDGVLVRAMKQGGLIPFTKSNVPQLAMIFESNNFLWGRGKNPWNQQRGIGGSSGGQGGLIAARCSMLGIGSDVGGSIRIPAQFCGVYGLKSSDSRLSNNYQTDYSVSFSGMDTLKVVVGPLSNSVQGLALWMKTATNQSLYKGMNDPYNKNIPFDTKVYKQFQTKKNLRIGYLKSFDLIQTTPAHQRAVQEVMKVCQSLGHTLVPVQIPNQKYIIRAFFSQFAAQGDSATFMKMLKGQDFTPQYNQIKLLSTMNSFLLNAINLVYHRTAPRLGFLLQGSKKKTCYQYLVHAGTVLQYRNQLAKYWRQNKLDLIIMPGFGSQANLHGYSQKTTLAASYTFLWNVLGTTVGAMPITLCRKQEQLYESKHNDQITQKLKQTAKNSSGLPVGIQVVGLPFEDEKVLGFMKFLQKQILFHKKHPYPTISPKDLQNK